MGAVVAGLGAIAGGLAGQAIMGKPTTYGPDTSVPGVGSATIKKGGKGQPDVTVPQMDISQSLKWFKDAADVQAKYYQQGLDYYNTALKEAAVQINDGYKKANQTLAPLSYSSNQALNQQMRMMGLDPISSTKFAPTQAKELGMSADLARQMSEAERIKDPTERAKVKEQIMTGISSYIDSLNTQKTEAAKDIAKPMSIIGQGTPEGFSMFGPTTDRILTPAEAQKIREAGITVRDSRSQDGTRNTLLISEADLKAYNEKMQTAYNKQVADQKLKLTQLGESINNVSDFKSTYNDLFTDQYDSGFTGQQVTDAITATPGYQFQMDQGTKAIERQGAARGMLGSGNTLTALTEYGQGLAQNFYGIYMDNLANIVNQGSPATARIADNQINQGKDYGALIEAGGSAGMQTSQLTGQAYGDYYNRSANAYADAALFNAQMQYNGIQAEQNRTSNMQLQGMQSAANNQMAGIAQARLNYDVFRGQQGGQAYQNAVQAASGGRINYGNYSYSPKTGWTV